MPAAAFPETKRIIWNLNPDPPSHMSPFASRLYAALNRRISPVVEPIPGAVFSAGRWLDARPSVAYISDGAGWVLDEIGRHISRRVSGRLRFRALTSYRGLRDSIVHFAAPPLYLKDRVCKNVHPSNTQVLTWTHGLPNNPDANIQSQIAHLAESERYLTRINFQTTMAHDFLLSQGVSPEKLAHIPLGVDAQAFQPPTEAQRRAAREALGVPEGAVCIGSFQKDSPGWDNSNRNIKWVKGPDVLADVLTRLAGSFPLFVLLTTPSRGYVISRLEEAGIAYRHDVLPNLDALPFYYHALDMYIIPARDEGGPMALLEAMASGVPVVSTRMGMPRDVLSHGITGWLADIEDVDGLAAGASYMIEQPDKAVGITYAARDAVMQYDWSVIVEQYVQRLYAIQDTDNR